MLIFGILGAAAPAQEAGVTLDESLVYYGDPLDFSKPAIIDVEAVFMEIKEYRQILDEGLGPQDAEYWQLLDKANAKFQARLEVVASEQGYDLICGAIEYDDGRTVPEITETVKEDLD